MRSCWGPALPPLSPVPALTSGWGLVLFSVPVLESSRLQLHPISPLLEQLMGSFSSKYSEGWFLNFFSLFVKNVIPDLQAAFLCRVPQCCLQRLKSLPAAALTPQGESKGNNAIFLFGNS